MGCFFTSQMLFPAETQRRRGNRREDKNISDWSSLRLSPRLCVSAGNTPLRWFRVPQFQEALFPTSSSIVPAPLLSRRQRLFADRRQPCCPVHRCWARRPVARNIVSLA